MSPSSLNYLRTTALAASLGVFALGLALIAALDLGGIARAFLEGVGSLAGVACLSVALGGLVVLFRSRGLERGRPDLFLRMNANRDLGVVSSGKLGWGTWVRRFFRRLLRPPSLLVGDLVQVRSLQEIKDTLDESGSLDGLPFMEEMAAFCGQRFRVFRCVDKIFDYGRSARLRRIEDVVLLTGLRCDGSAHGGCQAGCSLLWKTAWVKRMREDPKQADAHGPELDAVRTFPVEQAPQSRYTCQFTQLTAASRRLSRWDIRQDLRPLLSGNLTLRAFSVGMLTRVFNRVERLRGGPGYPPLSQSTRRTTPVSTYGLAPGDTVRVVGSERIAATLDQASRNRGLWFDLEMLKHCGQQCRVSRRVDRIIDIATGQILAMKTPCLVLQGVDSSGEFLRFWAQHEPLYWREVWLEPDASTRPTPSPPGQERISTQL
jgi:hypothetical protein